MRRRLIPLLGLCLLASACSGSFDSAVTELTDPLDTDADGDAGADQIAGADDDPAEDDQSAPATTDDEAPAMLVERDPGPDLPGLIDTSDEAFDNDTSVRTGTLDNGLRYYVRSNDNPGNKAELRLAIKAGSVDELGASTGLAHFAEHMLFNGTETFPENELIDVLRSFGASFGADVNAYTSFDETVYKLNVPNEPESVEVGLNVLEQWLTAATLDDEQVVAERGVVLDEWRVRTQTTGGRLFQIAEQMFLEGSPYGGRSPIGTDESIENMSTAELREFYDAWYRPDNAAVVVVGQIDVDGIVADIERLFGPASPRSGELPGRPDLAFDVDTEPAFALHSDPDQQTVDVEVTLPLPADTRFGTAGLRTTLVDGMIYDVLVRRLDQDISDGTAPFDEVTPGGNSFVDTLDAPALYSFTDAARVSQTLQALLDEYERAYRYGFTADETELAKENVRSFYESRFDARDSTQDRTYADQYVSHFLSGEPYPSVSDEFRIATGVIDAITPEALDERFRARLWNSAPHVIISTPQSQAGEMPTEAEVMALIAELPGRDIARRPDRRELPDALMERPAPGGDVDVTQLLPPSQLTFQPFEIELANGVIVRLTENKIVEGQVNVQARSAGGSSLVADEDVIDALYATEIVTQSGIAGFNQSELDEILAGDDVRLNAWITPYLENFSGSAATSDLETLFQLIHLYMTQPRFDQVALNQVERRERPIVDDPGSDPGRARDDVLLDLRYGGEQRYTSLPEPEAFDTLDLAGVERVWNDRFGSADGWVFAFAGDVDRDTIVELANAYLATVPTSGDTETWIDVEDDPPPGIAETSTLAGTGETASVVLLFTSRLNDVDSTVRATTNVVTAVIDARLNDVIREDLGETYSPRAVTYITADPDPAIETYVLVTGSPDRVGSIADLVTTQFADLASAGPDGQEFSNAFAQVDESYGFVSNGQFLGEMLDDAIYPAFELEDYVDESRVLASVTAESVRSFIATHIDTSEYVQVTVLPR